MAVLSAPGVARLLDTGEQDGVIYLVREYAAGSSLRVRLDEAGPASPAETVRIGAASPPRARRGARSRRAPPGARRRRRDRRRRRTSVSDRFRDRCRDRGEPTRDAAELLGDEHLAPEQIAGEGTDARTDLYAVASLLFGSLTGEAPRGRTSARGIRPDVPRALDRVLARALDPDPERRFPSARSFADALERSVDAELVDVPDDRTDRGRVHLDRRSAHRRGDRRRRDHAWAVAG